MHELYSKVAGFFSKPGVVKTPMIAVTGWFTWSAVKGLFEAIVLVCTTIIVLIHVLNAITRQWCPRRRTGLVSKCQGCPLNGNMLCPIKIRDDDDI